MKNLIKLQLRFVACISINKLVKISNCIFEPEELYRNKVKMGCFNLEKIYDRAKCFFFFFKTKQTSLNWESHLDYRKILDKHTDEQTTTGRFEDHNTEAYEEMTAFANRLTRTFITQEKIT